MGNANFSDEFKRDAVAQMTEALKLGSVVPLSDGEI